MFQFLSAALVAFALVSLAPAPNATPTDKYEGKVVAVKEGLVSLQNAADGQNKDFTIDGSTVITRNGKPAQLKEVQIEDKAEITAVTVGDKLIAKTLAVLARA